MAQKQIEVKMTDREREHGFTVCQDAQGNLIKGPESIGHKYGVEIDVSCPAGYKPVSIYHSHPRGTTYPSPADIREARRLGIRHLCIGIPDKKIIECYEVTKKGIKRSP